MIDKNENKEVNCIIRDKIFDEIDNVIVESFYWSGCDTVGIYFGVDHTEYIKRTLNENS